MSAIFPHNFLWGTATAAHQVEGHNFNNDWWAWEKRGGKIKNGDSSSVACDWSGGRYAQDFQNSRALGLNAIRLSIEWSRLEPREGEWDPDAFRFYRDMLTCLRDMRITPMVTIHHFTNPSWLAAQGGWENPAVVHHFERLATQVAQEFADLCRFWLTVNEANAYATLSYCAGLWPPGKQRFFSGIKVMANMVRAHAAAYHAIKRVQPGGQIGMAHRFQIFKPNNPRSPLDCLSVRVRDCLFNRLVFRAVMDGALHFPGGLRIELPEAKGTQDFIGLNYYFSERSAFDLREPRLFFGRRVLAPESLRCQSDFAGEADHDPASFERLLKELAHCGKPVYITENGAIEARDSDQSEYLVTHLLALQHAIEAGADVRGYFWWTLVDNFEWGEGFSPRFGLYSLDRPTQRRTPKPVAAVYSQIASENRIAPDLAALYASRADLRPA